MTTAVLVAMGLAIVLLGTLVVGLLRSHADILRALHRLGVDDPVATDDHQHRFSTSPRPRLREDAPADVAGETLRGSAVKIGVAGVQTRTLLAFLSSGCSACLGLWQDLRADPTAGIDDVRLVVVTKGTEAESRSRLLDLAPSEVTVVQSTPAWDDYGVPVTPFFVLVDGPTGDIIGEGSASSWAQVRSLMVQANADRAATSAAAEAGRDPELSADAELKAAGIGPGHPSLYPDRPPVEEEQ